MRQSLAITVLTAALLAACSSQPPAPEQKPAPVEKVPETAPVKKEIVDPWGMAALKDPKNILSKRSIFFDFDQYVIKDEFKPLVEAHAKFLVHNAGVKMLVQGNADERGSREYNLALGQKRAEAVKKALLLLGAKEDQIEAVSLGEEKPRCTDHGEDCWAQNRRDDMLYTGEY